MALNPIENLNVFDADLRKELRSRAFSKNLVRTRAPFLRFTVGANMDDLKNFRNTSDYNGCTFFTLGLHGYDNTNYSASDLYGTQSNKGLVVGTTYKQNQQILVRTAYKTDKGAPSQTAQNYVPPGITTAKVERVRSGNVLKFTIDVQCSTQEQLELLDQICFVPGMTCVLEWGSMFTTTTGTQTLSKTLNFKNVDETKRIIDESRKLSRLSFIELWCKPNNYNYDWAVANIANVKTSLQNNVYKTTITAYGVADNLLYISAYATANPLNTSNITASSISIQEFFRLNGEFTQILEQCINNEIELPSQYKDKLVTFTDNEYRRNYSNYLATAQSTGNANDLGAEDVYWMTLDFFIDLIVNSNGILPTNLCSIINRGLSTSNFLETLIAPLTKNQAQPFEPISDTIFVGYNRHLRSTSPETMLIYNPPAVTPSLQPENTPNTLNAPLTAETRNTIANTLQRKIKEQGIQGKVSDSVYNKLTVIPFGGSVLTDSGTAPLFRGVWINSKAIQSAFINARTIMEGFEVLLRNINAATENYWDLKLYYDDDAQAYRILDDNNRTVAFTNNDKIYEFNKKLDQLDNDVIGPDVLDISLQTDYPKLLFSQLAISGINNGFLIGDPQRKDVDFKAIKSVRDIFTTDPIIPQLTTGSFAVGAGTFDVTTFLRGQKLINQQEVSNITGQFLSTTLPLGVLPILGELFAITDLLTVEQARRFKLQLTGLKNEGKITDAGLAMLTQLFALRARTIITLSKEKEKSNFQKGFSDVIYRKLPRPELEQKNIQQVFLPPEYRAVLDNIEKSKQQLLQRINNVAVLSDKQTQSLKDRAESYKQQQAALNNAIRQAAPLGR